MTWLILGLGLILAACHEAYRYSHQLDKPTWTCGRCARELPAEYGRCPYCFGARSWP